ncbi:MFS general substrate transporter [Auriculariales sp. MPI-PUGE-AT-0066]|nr:MFS general substrate transporter [Auriculariales sp. MPI-PUGE-AT-0066]
MAGFRTSRRPFSLRHYIGFTRSELIPRHPLSVLFATMSTAFDEGERFDRVESQRTSADATAVHGTTDPMHDEEIENTGTALPPGWDNDPENPYNFSKSTKWKQAGIIGLYTLTSPLASSMLAPGLTQMAITFKTRDPTLVAMILSIFVLGFAIGPMVYGPLSEVYGRRWVLHFSAATFLIFNTVSIWAPNLTAILLFRLLAGLFGSAAVAIGGGVISDLFRPDERAAAMGLYSLGPLLGPIIGPIAGGFIAGGPGYKYIFVTVSVLAAVAMLIGLPGLKESYAPVILQQRARRQYQEAIANGEPTEKIILPNKASLGHVLWINLTRPLDMLFRSLIISALSIYISVIFGIFYLCLTTFPLVFESIYHWKTSVVGLAYLGLGFGFFFAAVIGSGVMNKVYLDLKAKNGGVATPEFRLPGMIVGSIVVPAGLILYAWTARESVHWVVPIIGSGIFSAGTMLCMIPIQLYLVDSYEYAASALATNALLRSLFGFAFPLFAQRLFENLGIGPGNTLLAGLAVLLGVPFPIFLWYRGDRLRAMDRFTRKVPVQ